VKLLARILPDDEEEDRRLEHPDRKPGPEGGPKPQPLHWGWTAAVAAAAAIPRLLYLFVFTDPENPGLGAYNDVWHHWQIAYLTKEIGLSAPGGPRLWDLKGLDYFWGVLHPLLMVGIFDLTGSIDIVLTRLVSLVFGVLVVVLVFHICRRYWGRQAAIGAALVASLLPTSVMNDASGMLEPLGVALCLLGIWAWQKPSGFWSGLAFGLATMARAEAWIFSLGMIVAACLRKVSAQHLPLVATFAVVMLLYMKVLLDHTGNALYPLWWNFFANAAGRWEVTPISAQQAAVRPVLGVLLVVAAAGLAWTLWKRPASYMLLTFGLGYWVFVAGMLGFTSYLASWVWWMPITRVFAFPYVFAGVLVAMLLLWWAPRRFGKRAIPVGWTALAACVVVAQLVWIPIGQVFGPTEANWTATLAASRQLGGLYNQTPYEGHSLAVPADRPDVTYGLARYGHVEGKHLVSEMYDPFYYLPSGYRFQDHQQVVSTLVQCWLAKTDTRLMAMPPDNQNYMLLREINPDWFVQLGTMSETNWLVYGVSVTRPAPTACEEASRAAASH
jgi:hypothetical protein